ncbi:hypothetical protein D9M72_421500 [compost metagenome]
MLQHQFAIFLLLWAVANHQRRKRSPDEALGPRERLHKQIGTLQVPHHANIEKIDSIRPRGDHLELPVVDPIVDQFVPYTWRTDLGEIGLALEVADKNERIREPLLNPFQREDKPPDQGAAAIVEAPPVRGIEAGYAIPVDPQG